MTTDSVRSQLERVWELHTSSEFATLDVDATMETMTDAPAVLHVPTLTDGPLNELASTGRRSLSG
ncbi:hypothetical protein AB0D12_23050 [Streptomyces sp. NPDC048479]|uniref:hypothetical protein n=1 Tax=Streptomyces sp. NPDC048479 TaxID=3154725 RepID=UPI003438A057